MPKTFTLRRIGRADPQRSGSWPRRGALPSAAAASTSQITIIQDAGLTDPTRRPPSSDVRRVPPARRHDGADHRPLVADRPGQLVAHEAACNAAIPNALSRGELGSVRHAAVRRRPAVRHHRRFHGLRRRAAVGRGQKLPGAKSTTASSRYKPNASEYGKFMTAIASATAALHAPGQSSPLPTVHFWAIWNEPNFGEDLGPQAINGSKIPLRADACTARSSTPAGTRCKSTGHGHDTILIGGYARGAAIQRQRKFPGNYAQTKPLLFIRDLYCVDKNYRQLSGKTAKAERLPDHQAAARASSAPRTRPCSTPPASATIRIRSTGSPLNDGKGDPELRHLPRPGQPGQDAGQGHQALRLAQEASRSTTTSTATSPVRRPTAHRAARYTCARQGGGLHELGRVPQLQEPAREVLHAVPAARSQPADQRPSTAASPAGSSSPTAPRSRPTTPSTCRCACPRPRSRTPRTSRSGATSGPANFETADRAAVGRDPAAEGRRAVHSRRSRPITISKRQRATSTSKMKFPASGNVQLAYTYPSAASDPLLPVGIGGTTITSRSFAIKVH